VQQRADVSGSDKEEVEVSAEIELWLFIDDDLSDGVSERKKDSGSEHFGQDRVLLEETGVGGEHGERRSYNFS
jgi:hypothetical protein